MSYTEMELDELYDAMKYHATEIAEIATSVNKTLVLIVNGKGNRPVFQLIDTDPVEEVFHG